MSFPHRVARVTLSGSMFGGSEIWSTGFFMGSETADSGTPTNQGAADIGAAFSTFFTTVSSRISPQYTFKECKIATLNNDGKTMADSVVYWSPPTTVVGTSTQSTFPAQCALAVTLKNSLARGLATKGRMYLPGIAITLDATGKLSTIQAGAIADNFKTFFDSIYNDADTPGRPVLASLGRGPLHEGGAIRNVSTISVGDVVDTQRRRRNGFTETYQNRSVAGL